MHAFYSRARGGSQSVLGEEGKRTSWILRAVAVILRAMTKQDKSQVNCQYMSQSVQGGDKSHQTYQSLRSILELVSFVQGPVEVSHSG